MPNILKLETKKNNKPIIWKLWPILQPEIIRKKTKHDLETMFILQKFGLVLENIVIVFCLSLIYVGTSWETIDFEK